MLLANTEVITRGMLKTMLYLSPCDFLPLSVHVTAVQRAETVKSLIEKHSRNGTLFLGITVGTAADYTQEAATRTVVKKRCSIRSTGTSGARTGKNFSDSYTKL